MQSIQGLVINLTEEEIRYVSGGIHLVMTSIVSGGAALALLVNVIGIGNTMRLSGGIIANALCKAYADWQYPNNLIMKYITSGYCMATACILITKSSNITIPTNVYNYYSVKKT